MTPRTRRVAIPRRTAPRAGVAPLLGALLAAGVAATATAAVAPRHGASLIVAARGPVGTLDPARADTPAERDLVGALFDRLVAESPDGTLTGAAASAWSVSSDSTRWTFTLRQGLRFSNGRPVTARDFVASWARLTPEAVAGPRRAAAAAVRAEALDERTLVVDRRPSLPAARLLATLADPLFSAVQVVAGPEGESLLGSGPFRFGGSAEGRFLLVARPDHPLGRPAPARVLVAPYADEAAGRTLLDGLAVARHDESGPSTAARLATEPGVRGLRRTSAGVLDFTLAFVLR